MENQENLEEKTALAPITCTRSHKTHIHYSLLKKTQHTHTHTHTLVVIDREPSAESYPVSD